MSQFETLQDNQLLSGPIPFDTRFYETGKIMDKDDNKNNQKESDEKKDEEEKDFIKNNLYINGKAIIKKENIKHGSGDLYSVTFKHEFKEGKKKIKLGLKIEHKNNRTSMIFQNYEYDAPNKAGKIGDLNDTIEVDASTHNQYDVVMDENGNRMNFNIVYNEYKTQEFIKNIIRNKDIKPIPKFDHKDEFENTQLGGLKQPLMEIKDLNGEILKNLILGGAIESLHNPKLGSKKVEAGAGYYRTLYYSVDGKEIDIAKVYFKSNGDFDAETTEEKYSVEEIQKQLDEFAKDNPKFKKEIDIKLKLGGGIEGLNNPKLGKQVEKDDIGYYRTLYYRTNGKKYDITKVYFKTNGDFDLANTQKAIKESQYEVLGVKLDFDINENLEFTITDATKKALEKKVTEHRDVLIKAFNDEELVVSDIIFSGLNKEESIKDNKKIWQFNPEIICLEPISSIYKIYLNIEGKIDPLYCKVEGNDIILVDETGRARDEIYINYDKNFRLKIFKEGGKLKVQKIREELENPKEMLPDYKGGDDEGSNAVNLLKSSGNLTNFDGYLNYFNNKGNLIAKMPCDKKEDGGYEFNDEKYHERVEPLKLYNYHEFKPQVQRIKEITSDLGIADADIQDIFTELLQEKGLKDFNQKVVEVINPATRESIYYNMTSNFKITLANRLYKIARECVNSLKNRLELAQIINKGRPIYYNDGEYQDFQTFVGGKFGVGKHIASTTQLKEFISGKSKEITVKLSRGDGQGADITYTATSDTSIEGRLSGNDKGEVTIASQVYTVRTNKKQKEIDLLVKENGARKKIKHTMTMGDILFDPKEIRK